MKDTITKEDILFKNRMANQASSIKKDIIFLGDFYHKISKDELSKKLRFLDERDKDELNTFSLYLEQQLTRCIEDLKNLKEQDIVEIKKDILDLKNGLFALSDLHEKDMTTIKNIYKLFYDLTSPQMDKIWREAYSDQSLEDLYGNLTQPDIDDIWKDVYDGDFDNSNPQYLTDLDIDKIWQ